MTCAGKPGLGPYLRLLILRPRWGIHWLNEFYHYRLQRQSHSSRYDEYANHIHTAEEVQCTLAHAEHSLVKAVFEELEKLQVDPNTPEGRVVKSFMPEDVAQLCYGMVRLRKPSVIVETGVERGNTSFYILKALQTNAKGRLYSIDFPVPGTEDAVGELVPPSLRERWSLSFGIGLEEMRRLRREIPEIDMFLHDSDHSYHNQIAEYRFALSWLKKGGILVSDDVENNAFIEACETAGIEPLVVKQWSYYVGIAVK